MRHIEDKKTNQKGPIFPKFKEHVCNYTDEAKVQQKATICLFFRDKSLCRWGKYNLNLLQHVIPNFLTLRQQQKMRLPVANSLACQLN